jgi:hypothetical protein
MTRISSAGIVFTDGFGDGDRDNNGLDAGATATDATDVGVPWLLTDGNSAVTFKATDDSAGIGTANALQLFNTASNNRPAVGHFTPQTLNDGDSIVLKFDLRLVTTSAAADRAIRFGLYHDTSANDGTADHGSSGSLSVDDVGYNCRVDAGNDVSNSTSLDITRDDTPSDSTIIQATTTGLSISSSNSVNQLADALKHHFVLTLTRSGTSIQASLQEDSNAAISGTDASPANVGFTFDEVAIGVRSSASMDTRWDNFEVDYVPGLPEPGSLALLGVGAMAMLRRSRRRALPGD